MIVHQRALVDQAIKEAEQVSLARNPEFSRTARAIHSGASEAAVLAADDTDFAAITWQTLGGTNSAYLKHWFKRPCYLVVDEAHHVGAPDWDRLLRRCRRYRNVRGVIGLTATPNPVSAVKLSRRQRHFPTISYQKTLLDLIEAGILARPEFHPVRTRVSPELDRSQENALIRGSEVPGEVLFKLATVGERNRLIVDEYLRRQDTWGKTIIFTIDIHMADTIGDLLESEKVPHMVVHSGVTANPRDEALEWFRSTRGPAVLVAVSMLNEGVDLPSAKTAFIARPTTNRTLLKQMVGRVLRGIPSGGSAEANVVDFRDDWPSLAMILGPEAAFDTEEVTEAIRTRARTGELPPGWEAALELLLEPAWAESQATPAESHLEEESDSRAASVPVALPIENLRLAGGYRLDNDDVPLVPVLAHQRESYERFVAWAESEDRTGLRSPERFFEDDPDPQPLIAHLRALREAVSRDEYKWVELEAPVGVAVGVERVRQAGEPDWTGARRNPRGCVSGYVCAFRRTGPPAVRRPRGTTARHLAPAGRSRSGWSRISASEVDPP